MLSLEEFKSIEALKKKHNGKILIQPSDKAFLVTAASDIFESVYAAVQDICSQKNVTAEAGSKQMTPEHKTDYDSIRSKGLLPKKGNEISKCIEVHDRQFFKTLLKEDLSKFEHLAKQHDVTICKIEKSNRFGFDLRGSEDDVMCIFNSLNEKIMSKKQKMQHDNGIPAENFEAQMEASSPNAANKSCVLKLLIKYIRLEGKNVEDDAFQYRVLCSFDFQAFWNFYNQTDCGRKMLEAILEKHHCRVSLVKDEPFQGLFVLLILNQRFHEKSDVKQFVQVILDTVQKNAEQEFLLSKLTVDPRLHKDVLERVRLTKELDSVWIESGGEQGHEICMVCLLEHKMIVIQRMSDIVNSIEESFKNHKELVCVDLMWQRVMIHFGYLQKVNYKFPNLMISCDESKNAFVLKGPRDEAKAAADTVLELLGTAQCEISEMTFSPSCRLEIFTHSEMSAYINRAIPAVAVVWLLNPLTKKIHLFAKDPKQLQGIQNAIKGCVQEKFYPVLKDHSISTQKIARYLEELKKQHTGRLVMHSSTEGLWVTAADDIIEMVDAAIQEIISRERGADQDAHKPEKEDERDRPPFSKSVPARTGGYQDTSGLVPMKGMVTEREIKEIISVANKEIFNKLVEKDLEEFKCKGKDLHVIVKEVETETKVGFELEGSTEKEVGDVLQFIKQRIELKEQQLHAQKGIGDSTGATASPEEGKIAGTNATAKPDDPGLEQRAWSYPNGKKIMLVKATSCDADVIIIPGNSDKDGQSQFGNKKLVKLKVPDGTEWKAKTDLQEEVEQVLKHILEKTVGICIKDVEGWNFHHYLKCFLYGIYKCFMRNEGKPCPVECVILLFEDASDYNKAVKIIQTSFRLEQDKSEVFAGQRLLPQGPIFKRIQVKVKKGQLHEAQAEVLVNTVDRSLDLTKGVISSSLLDKAGNRIQRELQQYQGKVVYGEVLTTGVGTLPKPCMVIFHGVLYTYQGHSDSVKVFQDFLARCLEGANKKYRSIAFPPIGTGRLGYPKDLVASLLFQSVAKFEEAHPKSKLEEVIFVIYEKDQETLKIFEELYRRCIVSTGSEGIQPTETESHLSSEKRVDGSLRESSTRDKENENIYNSPTLEGLKHQRNGVSLVKIGGGKIYALPFLFATKPQIMYSEGFYCIMHDNVWYRFQQYSLDSLHLQNMQTKNCIKLIEYSKSMHGTGARNKKHTNSSHNECQESLDSQTIAESSSMAMEAITNTLVETAQSAEDRIVTETDKLAAKRTEINKGETCETHNEEKPIDESEDKSRTGATMSSGGNAVKGFEAEIDTNIDQTHTGDPVQRFKGEFSRGETNNISGDTGNTKEDESQASKEEVIQSKRRSARCRLLRKTGKKPKKEILIENVCEIEGIDRFENFGYTGSTSEGNVSNISSSPEAATETVSGNTQILKLLIKYLKKQGKKTGADLSKYTVPCSMNLQLMWNFFMLTDCGKEMVDAIVTNHHCKVSLSADDNFKEFFIFQVLNTQFHDELDAKHFVDGVLHSVYVWAQESLSVNSFEIDPRIQDDVRERINERKELTCVWIEWIGKDMPIMYIVCHKDFQQLVMQIITEVITDATKSFNSHKEMVTADFMWQMVMTRFEYLKEIFLNFPSTEIIQDKSQNAFLLKGPKDEVKAVAGHLEELLRMAHKEVHEEVFSPDYQFEIFTSSEMCDYIDKSLPKLPVIWIPNHLTKEIHLFSRDPELLKGMDKSITDCIEEKLYPLLKDNSTLASEKIRLLEKLKKKHGGKIVIHISQSPTGLLLTTADDIFKDVDAAVQTIISSEIDEVHLETFVPEKLDGKDEQPGCKSHISNPGKEMKDLSPEKVSDVVQKITRSLEVKDENIFRKLIIMEHMEKINQIAKEHCVSIKVCETQSIVGFVLNGLEKEVQFIYDAIRLQEQQFQQDISVIAGATGKVHKQMLPNSDAAGKSGGNEMSDLNIPMTSEKVPTPSIETARTYLEMIGDASNTSMKKSDTVQERSQQFKTMAGKETKARCSDSQSLNILTGSFDIIKLPEEDTDVPGSCPSATNLSEVEQDNSIVYIECKIEVAEDVLNSIKITYGRQGIDSLISDLDQLAKVDTHKDRILVFCDYKDAENVQKCVRNYYNEAKEERKMKEENKHLIHGGNENLKEWLQFAYGHTSWIKNLQLEGGELYLTGTSQMKREVEKAVHSMNYWYKEEFTLSSEEQHKADEVVAVIKSELPTIFIKQTKEIMMVLSDNRDNFERACFKVKVALGRIKITARGRRYRDPLSYGESYSVLSKNDRMDAEPY